MTSPLLHLLNTDGLKGLERFHIKVSAHSDQPWYILNYDQVHSKPKDHPVVRECRNKVVARQADGTFVVLHQSFYRFFNLSEHAETKRLHEHPDQVIYQTKHDGSLVGLFWADDQWQIVTRGSWGQQNMMADSPTYREVILRLLGDRFPNDTSYCYVFELCSPWNRIVRFYETPQLVLLAAFRPQVLHAEMKDDELDRVAEQLHVSRPETFDIASPDHVHDRIRALAEATQGFEGLVAKVWSDDHQRFIRVKIKAESYLALHHALTTPHLTWKRALPLLINNEADELMAYQLFQRWRDTLEAMRTHWEQCQTFVREEWAKVCHHQTPKDMALATKKHPLQGLFIQMVRQQVAEIDDTTFWTTHAERFAKNPPLPWKSEM